MPIIKKSLSDMLKSKPNIDWDRVRRTTDAEIARQIAEDPDTAPDMTKDIRGKYSHLHRSDRRVP